MTEPIITTLSTDRFPPLPKGWRCTNLTKPDKLSTDAAHYPVLLSRPYTCTALSPTNPSERMNVVVWDKDHNIVAQVVQDGARYIWKIGFDALTQVVTFTGQSQRSISAPLNELIAPGQPGEPTLLKDPTPSHNVTITTLNVDELLSLPEGWECFNLIDPNKLIPDSTHYPVLLAGPYTCTALSPTNTFKLPIDELDRFNIVVWTERGQIVNEIVRGGACHLWKITFDPTSQVVTFTGQYFSSVRVSLNELLPLP